MRSFVVLTLIACAGAALVAAQDPDAAASPAAGPTAEHRWLMQGVGERESVATTPQDAGEAATEVRSIDRTRAIGEFWTVTEGEADVFGTPFIAVLTIGYDPEKGKFVGTWIDSSSTELYHYVGALDEAGKVLTLEAEGPLPWDPSRRGKYRFKDGSGTEDTIDLTMDQNRKVVARFKVTDA